MISSVKVSSDEEHSTWSTIIQTFNAAHKDNVRLGENVLLVRNLSCIFVNILFFILVNKIQNEKSVTGFAGKINIKLSGQHTVVCKVCVEFNMKALPMNKVIILWGKKKQIAHTTASCFDMSGNPSHANYWWDEMEERIVIDLRKCMTTNHLRP